MQHPHFYGVAPHFWVPHPTFVGPVVFLDGPEVRFFRRHTPIRSDERFPLIHIIYCTRTLKGSLTYYNTREGNRWHRTKIFRGKIPVKLQNNFWVMIHLAVQKTLTCDHDSIRDAAIDDDSYCPEVVEHVNEKDRLDCLTSSSSGGSLAPYHRHHSPMSGTWLDCISTRFVKDRTTSWSWSQQLRKPGTIPWEQ